MKRELINLVFIIMVSGSGNRAGDLVKLVTAKIKKASIGSLFYFDQFRVLSENIISIADIKQTTNRWTTVASSGIMTKHVCASDPENTF